MMRMFSAYRKYPFAIPLRVKILNCFRYFFTFPVLEKFLLQKIQAGKTFYKRIIPPLYFYTTNSWRTANRDGINFHLDISCLIDHSIYFNTLKEPTWINLFKQLKKDFVVLDIGANIGFHTLNFAKICSKGQVYSFEPDSETFKRLSKNVEINEFRNIMTFQLALGAKPGQMSLYKLFVNNPGANRLLSHQPSGHSRVEMVDVTTCDLIVEQLQPNRIDLIKIDVEGFELFVLRGATQLIEKHRPILFVELAEVNLQEHSLTPNDLVSFIHNLGYEIKDAKTMNGLDLAIAKIHTDIICFPTRSKNLN